MIMQQLDTLTLIGLILAIIHFGTPLAYYYYAKKKWLSKPWNIKTNPNYKPKTTIIIPTYNEAKTIEKKLENIYNQDYPKNLIEIIVVDSASTDKTHEIVEKWAKEHKDVKLKLIREPKRRGKAHALNNALKHATGEILVIADADALWPRNALSEAIKWLSDPIVGAVSCLKYPEKNDVMSVEGDYRYYYNIMRVAESKAWSTPIFHGELAAFRRNLLVEIGGFPTDIGADDSYTATRIALMGYRAIIPEALWCMEAVPSNGYPRWRVRRAQHLIQHFLKVIKLKKSPREFRKVLYMEIFLHLINPWLLPIIVIILIISTIIFSSLFALATFILGSLLLALGQYRTWLSTQLFLLIAYLKNLVTKEIVWRKQEK